MCYFSLYLEEIMLFIGEMKGDINKRKMRVMKKCKKTDLKRDEVKCLGHEQLLFLKQMAILSEIMFRIMFK